LVSLEASVTRPSIPTVEPLELPVPKIETLFASKVPVRTADVVMVTPLTVVFDGFDVVPFKRSTFAPV
jgi:hypothetical protein